MAPLGQRGEAGGKPRAGETLSRGFREGAREAPFPRGLLRPTPGTAGRSAGWEVQKGQGRGRGAGTGGKACPQASPLLLSGVLKSLELPGRRRPLAPWREGCGDSGVCQTGPQPR